MASVPVDQEKVHEFVGKVLGDTSGLTTTILAALGDRLNLFKTLAGHGPATSAELATVASINERYAREWLGGMASAGYLKYDPATRRVAGAPPARARRGALAAVRRRRGARPLRCRAPAGGGRARRPAGGGGGGGPAGRPAGGGGARARARGSGARPRRPPGPLG